MASNDKDQQPKKLSEVFKEAWDKYQDIDVCTLPSVSEKYQENVSECIKLLIHCTNMVNMLSLFSSNETFDEISTQKIKYLLLPVFLGELYQKLTSSDRSETVNIALIYFKDFLKRCQEYQVTNKDLSRYYADDNDGANRPNRTLTREEKIKNFKQTKDLKEKIKVSEKRMKENADSVDEEIMREHYTDWLKLSIINSIDNIKLIKDEIDILTHMKNMKVRPRDSTEETKRPLPPFKPILITREMLKSKVFGAGYPSVPTMSEEEYFQMELRQGKIVQKYNNQKPSSRVIEDSEEKSSDDDDEESEEKLQKARRWDEWKDTHRRGEGNKERHG